MNVPGTVYPQCRSRIRQPSLTIAQTTSNQGVLSDGLRIGCRPRLCYRDAAGMIRSGRQCGRAFRWHRTEFPGSTSRRCSPEIQWENGGSPYRSATRWRRSASSPSWATASPTSWSATRATPPTSSSPCRWRRRCASRGPARSPHEATTRRQTRGWRPRTATTPRPTCRNCSAWASSNCRTSPTTPRVTAGTSSRPTCGRNAPHGCGRPSKPTTGHCAASATS